MSADCATSWLYEYAYPIGHNRYLFLAFAILWLSISDFLAVLLSFRTYALYSRSIKILLSSLISGCIVVVVFGVSCQRKVFITKLISSRAGCLATDAWYSYKSWITVNIRHQDVLVGNFFEVNSPLC